MAAEETFNLSKHLNEQRKKKLYCDIVLLINDEKFPCHRNVLAASSGYFERLFSSGLPDSDAYVVPLKVANRELFPCILDCIYGEKFDINLKNAYNLLKLGDYFDIEIVEKKCKEFIVGNSTVENLFEICEFALHPLTDPLFMRAVIDMAAKKFYHIADTYGFLTISFELLQSLLKSRSTLYTLGAFCNQCSHAALDHDNFFDVERNFCRMCEVYCRKCYICGHSLEDHCENVKCNLCDIRCDTCMCGCTWCSHILHESSFPECDVCPSPCEFYVSLPLVKWVNFDVVNRINYFPQLIKYTGLNASYVTALTALISKYTAEVNSQWDNRLNTECRISILAKSQNDDSVIFTSRKKQWIARKSHKFSTDNVRMIRVKNSNYFFTPKTSFTDTGRLIELWKEDETNFTAMKLPPVFGINYRVTSVENVIYLYLRGGSSLHRYDPISRHDLDETTKCDTIFSYSTDLNEWFSVPKIPIPVYYSYLVSLNDEVFLIGGYSSTSDLENSQQKILQRYNHYLAQWTQRSIEVDLNMNGAVCSCGDNIYICEQSKPANDCDKTDKITVLYIYNHATNEWRIVTGRKSISRPYIMLNVKELIYILPRESKYPIEIFNTKTNDWTFSTIPKFALIDGIKINVNKILDAYADNEESTENNEREVIPSSSNTNKRKFSET